MQRFIFAVLILLFAINIASAEIDSFEFDVMAGSNELDFGKMYNGSFVSNISGVLYEYTNMSGSHYQQITLTAVENINNATIDLVIPYNSYMKSDYADLRFYDNGLNELPYYISNYTVSDAEVKIKVNLSLGDNTVFMAYGNPDAVSKSDEASVYIYFNNVQSNYGNTTIFNGDFNSLHVKFKPITGSGQIVGFYLSQFEYPSFFHQDYSSGGYFVYYASNSSRSGNLSIVTNNANLTVDLIRNVNGSSTISVVNERYPNLVGLFTSDQVFNFSQIRSYVRGTLTIYKLTASNSTPLAYSFGAVTEIEPISETDISIPVLSCEFQSVSVNLQKPGEIDLRVNYTPHIVLLTNDEVQFDDDVTLQFQSNPSALSASYQISIDSNFFGIVKSGISSGTITASLLSGNYYWRVQQPDGLWTTPRMFTVNPVPTVPGSFNFTIRNELTNASVSATVKITNSTTTLQKTGSTVVFNSTEVTAGNYSVQINATGYTTRYYEVVSPGNYTLYILPTTNSSVVYFSLIDNTNQFQYATTKLEIIKQTMNGSIVVTRNYFDASGFVIATLNQFDSYVLKVISDSGDERILGNYVQAGQQSVQLVIADIILSPSDNSTFGGFVYNLTKSENGIRLDWTNQNDALVDPFEFYIYKDNALVMNVSSDAPFGSINYIENNETLDPNSTYRIVFMAHTIGGTIRVNEFYKIGGEAIGIDFEQIPVSVRIIVSLILLILIASLFNITNANFSAIVVTLVAAFLWFIGFLPTLPAVIIWMLFVAIVSYKTNG